MNVEELETLQKNNLPIYFENEKIIVIDYFEILNIAEIMLEDEKKILVDLSMLSPRKKDDNEKSINIFTGGNINDKSFG
ncbi:hypothetical protein P5E48_04535 [Clostridium perfringens]|jgi:hypothetical protein|uniref:hypothetical protein n=1 Tax=Clostridium perfringens TaxID=1502 RepID=UPI001CCACB84|nr:hypothetical protein [Clostridium perfringens]EJT5918995.1 hypothetical protein [Clostridium perfringens]MDK0533935.1 hypothetical protein [Clostridium perfringens]MDK0792507.1 hypothetical protein [Clostridium perfringens]MDK0903553.1 hypothetical protein [Clostridium perfringens]MDK0909391.1 hypothetical protein [Clostridium perfringens]